MATWIIAFGISIIIGFLIVYCLIKWLSKH